MLPSDLTEELIHRVVRILMYESSGRSSLYWSSPHLYLQKMQQPDQSAELFIRAYNEWSATKRSFQQEEVLEGVWIKIGDDGDSVVMRFFPHGRLEVASLFEPRRYWQGFWQLENGVLRMKIEAYECDALASREDAVHSGIEFVGGQNDPKAYFKLVHQNKMMKRSLLYNGEDMVYEGVTSLGRRIAISDIGDALLLPEAYDPDWWEARMPDEHVW